MPHIRGSIFHADLQPLQPADLQGHSCLDFSFRRVQAGWPFREDGQDRLLGIESSLVANNGDTLVQLARQGMGIARVGSFAVAADIAAGRLVPLLEAFNPCDTETIHAVFVGGTTLPARVRGVRGFPGRTDSARLGVMDGDRP